MKSQGRLMMFSIVACIAYTLAYYFDWSLFRYFPATNSFALGGEGDTGDQAILWYGWLATAVLVGAGAAVVTPRALAARLSPDLAWLIAVVLIFAALTYEKRWFM